MAKLSEYIKLMLAEVPPKTRVNFNMNVVIRKGEIFVTSGYESTKVNFSITKIEEK